MPIEVLPNGLRLVSSGMLWWKIWISEQETLKLSAVPGSVRTAFISR